MNSIKKILKNNWFQFVAFSGIIWLIFVHLHINRHLEGPIIGPHFWRKSDTYAQILNYYYNNLNFFDHGLYFNQLDSNSNVVGEFPLIYWLIAVQLKVFGNSLLLIKMNWILILNIGLFSVFKISEYFLKNILLALSVSLILFLSSVFTFYSVDFLPDPLALSLVFFGLWMLLRNHESPSLKKLLLSIFLISLAGMIKPFFLIPYVAFICVKLLQTVTKNQGFKSFLIYLVPFVCVGGWFIYSNWYNSNFGSDYYLSSTRSIWFYSYDDSISIWNRVITKWSKYYFHNNLYYTLLVLVIFNLVWWKKTWRYMNVFYILSVIGSFVFFILLYGMFKDHDYYIYPLFFMIPLTFGLALFKIMSVVDNQLLLSIVGIVLLFGIYFGINNSWKLNDSFRRADWINNHYIFEKYQNLEPFLLRSNVQKKDLVITASDISPSFALLLLDRKGWSGYQIKRSTTIKKMINQGAKYIILNDLKKLSLHDSLKLSLYLDYPIADTNHIFIYNIQPYKINN